MLKYFRRITIVRVDKTPKKDVNKDLQRFSHALGLFSQRDKEKSCFRVFIELLKAAKDKKPLSSDEIAYNANLSRGTVIHHLHKLMDAGIVVSYKNRYVLRVGNLEELVLEIKKDIMEVFKYLEKMAEELDEELKLLR